MNQKVLKTLEYDKIIELLSQKEQIPNRERSCAGNLCPLLTFPKSGKIRQKQGMP